MVVPGTYEVSLSKMVDGVTSPLGEPQRFETEALGTATLAAEDKRALLAFQQETAALQRAVLGAIRAVDHTEDRLAHIKKAILQAPEADTALLDETRALEDRLYEIQLVLRGDSTIRSRSGPTPPSVVQRVQGIVSGHWTSTSAPTDTHRESYRMAGEQFEPVLEDLRTLIERDVRALEDQLDRAGAPWTPGRLPPVSSLFSMVDERTRRIKSDLAIQRAAEAEPDQNLQDVTTSSVEAYRYYFQASNLCSRGSLSRASLSTRKPWSSIPASPRP